MTGLFSFKAKIIKPCSKFLSKFKLKFDKPSISLRAPTFRMPRRRNRPRIRTRTVRFRKPFSIKSLSFPQCRPKNKLRLRKRHPAVSSKLKGAITFRHPRRAKTANKPVQKVRIAELLTVLFSLRKAKEIERASSDQIMGDATSVSVSERGNGKEPFPSPITPAYARHSSVSKKDSSDDLEDVEDACRSFESHMVEMIVDEGKLNDLMDVEELLYCWKNLKSPVFIELVCRFYGELCKDLFSSSEQDDSQEDESRESQEYESRDTNTSG